MKLWMIALMTLIGITDAQAQYIELISSEPMTAQEQQAYILNNRDEVIGTYERPNFGREMHLQLKDKEVIFENRLGNTIVSDDQQRIIAHGANFDACITDAADIAIYDDHGNLLKSWNKAVASPYDVAVSDVGETFVAGLPLGSNEIESLSLIKFDQNGNFRWRKTFETDHFVAGISIREEDGSLLLLLQRIHERGSSSMIWVLSPQGEIEKEIQSKSVVLETQFLPGNKLFLLDSQHWSIMELNAQLDVLARQEMIGYSLGPASINLVPEQEAIYLFTCSFDESLPEYQLQKINLSSAVDSEVQLFEGQPFKQPYRLLQKSNSGTYEFRHEQDQRVQIKFH